MRRLTPMEIYNKDFKQEMRGYNKDEVNEFLDLIIQNYEDLIQENESLREQLQKAKRNGGGGSRSGSADLSAYEEVIEEILMRLERIESNIF
ncbi:DivIVA domain-containing protein [Seinonella peptonophila]|uniref:DivIVA domain-containing protein n=1 Tax=Seinonella peptonophila TaxID=112248 RepID=A0A1M4V5D2_9BACL|nr:DivIVA domain-containing protein [Seinonella peptonophila]SHE64186.1 DivIVA domain-containing protein [Seinonella peptonophila]